ncbi:transcription factor bhlh84 [Phtheirospermum japonicum]|uniref:Transcription factor bhlh84 n=1 Tax=Phtheirospermum japonicum TaxID=374723 RepID=A0A830BXS3_9LAMI|nr:transcription factor bhlh84 [Phtheirospermum japonicum]
MEHLGAISEGEWNSMNGMCSDEAEFMAQLLGNCSFPNELPSDSNFPAFWPLLASNDDIALADHESETNASMYSFSQESGGVYFPFPSSGHENGYYYNPSASHQVFVNNDNLMTMDFCMMENKEENNFLNQDVSNDSTESNEDLQLGTGLAIPLPEMPMEDKVSGFSECKKRARVPGQEVQRSNKRSMKLKKCMSVDDIKDEDNNNKNNNNNNNHNNKKNNNMGLHRQSSSSCISEDDSNGSQEQNGVASCSVGSKGSGALNLNGKKRAGRGSATDPQSLYARKRREKINERLKVLQNLVPNGTKVDISTMLEEAVQYVKFLQVQIKLLSSDDLWMYAPLAYNGMELGLDLKISTLKP